MKRRRHVAVLAQLVAATVETQPPRTARRLRRELAAVATDLDPVLARATGAVELIERCRDEHLAALDADDGLLVLGITWEEVVARLPGPPEAGGPRALQLRRRAADTRRHGFTDRRRPARP